MSLKESKLLTVETVNKLMDSSYRGIFRGQFYNKNGDNYDLDIERRLMENGMYAFYIHGADSEPIFMCAYDPSRTFFSCINEEINFPLSVTYQIGRGRSAVAEEYLNAIISYMVTILFDNNGQPIQEEFFDIPFNKKRSWYDSFQKTDPQFCRATQYIAKNPLYGVFDYMGDVREVLRETTPFILKPSVSGAVHVFDPLLTDDLLISYEFLETERDKEIAVGAKQAAFLNDGLIPYTCYIMNKAFFSAKSCWEKESQREKNIYLSILKDLDMDQNVVLDVAFWSPAVLDPETFLDGFAPHKVTFPYNQKMRTSDLSSIGSIKQGAKTLYQYPLPQKGTPK